MTDLVLDASVLIKWFHPEGEANVEQARMLRQDYEAGRLGILVPPLIDIELLNVAGRRWRWSHEKLIALAGALSDLGFAKIEPELSVVAGWCARGLTAYDATYVALAEATGSNLITADTGITDATREHATLLAEWPA